MGLLVSLPVGPKRAAVIHLALSTLRRTSIKEEKETFLATRRGDAAKKMHLFLLKQTQQPLRTFCPMLRTVTGVDVKPESCCDCATRVLCKFTTRLFHLQIMLLAACSMQEWQSPLIKVLLQQQPAEFLRISWALFIHPALIIHSNMAGETIEWNVFDGEFICFLEFSQGRPAAAVRMNWGAIVWYLTTTEHFAKTAKEQLWKVLVF